MLAPFQHACETGDVRRVQQLLCRDHDVDVHADNEYAFRMACFNGHANVVELLLGLDGDKRVDVHAVQEHGLRWACDGGHFRVVAILLQLRGDRRVYIHALGGEPRARAVKGRHYRVVALLDLHGAASACYLD